MAPLSAAAQLANIRQERARAFHGVPDHPLELGIRIRRVQANESAREVAQHSLQTQLEEVRATKRRNFLESGQSSSSHAEPTSTRTSNSVDTPLVDMSSEARCMLVETNRIRSEANCERLAWNSRLATIAERAAQQMARREAHFSHCGADQRFAEYPLGAGDTYGENLARSEGIFPLAPSVVNGWKASPGHFRNLVGPFTACGIGIANDEMGVCFVVQLLALVPGDDASHEVGTVTVPHPANSKHAALLGLLLLMAMLAWKGGWLSTLQQ